jgi:hypothetical protein
VPSTEIQDLQIVTENNSIGHALTAKRKCASVVWRNSRKLSCFLSNTNYFNRGSKPKPAIYPVSRGICLAVEYPTNGDSRAARCGFLPHRRRRMPTCGTTGDADRTHESPRRWRTISPSTKGSTLTSATTSALARRRRRGTSQVRAATSLSTSDVYDSRPTPRDRRALLSATRGMLARTVR